VDIKERQLVCQALQSVLLSRVCLLEASAVANLPSVVPLFLVHNLRCVGISNPCIRQKTLVHESFCVSFSFHVFPFKRRPIIEQTFRKKA